MCIIVERHLWAVSLIALAACRSEPPAKDPSATTTTLRISSSALESKPAAPPERRLTDAEIVAVTSTANTGEIEMAELAARSATNADVKTFAAMMIMQHRDMETKGKALATKAKITPADSEVSTKLEQDVEATVAELKPQKGRDFDKAYMRSQIKAHRDVLTMFDSRLLPSAENGELKELLTTARGHVASHLAKAEEVEATLEKPVAKR